MTEITSSDYSCINPGPDGSLDLYANPTWMSEEDKPYAKGVYIFRVHAGDDLKCDSEPRPHNESIDTILNWNLLSLQDSLNLLYNKLGINFTLNDGGVISANYDVINDDNILQIPEGAKYGQQVTGFTEHIENITSFFVPDIPGARGFAPNLYIDYCFLSNVTISNRTFAHELGHASFGLDHPDQNYKTDGLIDLVADDPNNYMNRGSNPITVRNLNEFKIRKYQWQKIYKKLKE